MKNTACLLFFFLTACTCNVFRPCETEIVLPVLNEKYDLWIYAKYVVSNDGILKNKYVGIRRDGTIGEISDQKPLHETIIDAGRHILAPGFINAHDHLAYNHRGPSYKYASFRAERYNHRRDWSGGCRGYEKRQNKKTGRPAFLIWNELRQVVAGTTSNIGNGGYRGFLRNFGDFPNEGLTLSKEIWNDTFPLKDNDECKHMLEKGDDYPFHPQNKPDNVYIIHVAEGKDAFARNEFVNISSDEGKRNNILGENIGLIHMVGVLEQDVKKVADAKATVIWSPRSNFALYGVTAPVSLMKDYGINLALGTDWAYSGSAHILEELKVAADYNEKYLNNIFTAKELWQMATVNPAKLMQLSDQIGDIRPGMQADLVLFYLGNREFKTDEEAYKAVISMDSSKTDLVMRGGTILYGRWTLLDGVISDIPGDFDEFFGAKYYIGATVETGYSYEELLAANKKGGTYRLFPNLSRKKTPITYPVSLKNKLYPAAPAYTGQISPADPDGDGITVKDSDPEYFNPIRPVDLTDNAGRQTRARRLKK